MSVHMKYCRRLTAAVGNIPVIKTSINDIKQPHNKIPISFDC